MAVSEPRAKWAAGLLETATLGGAPPARSWPPAPTRQPPWPGSVYFQGEAGRGFQVGVRGNSELTHRPSQQPSAKAQEQSLIQPVWGARLPGGWKSQLRDQRPVGARPPLPLPHPSLRPPGRTKHCRHGEGLVVVTPQLAQGEPPPQHTASQPQPQHPESRWEVSLKEQALTFRFPLTHLFPGSSGDS